MIIIRIVSVVSVFILSNIAYSVGYKTGYKKANEQATKELQGIEAKYIKLVNDLKFHIIKQRP